MALKGEDKKRYQRDYMRRRRQVVRPSKLDLVRPLLTYPVRPSHLPNCPDGRYRELDADGNVIPELT